MSDLQQRFKRYGYLIDREQKVRDTAFSIDKKTTQMAKKMVFAVHRHEHAKHLEHEILRELTRLPLSSRFRYGYLLYNARQEYLEAVLLREFIRQVEDSQKGGAEVTLDSIIQAVWTCNYSSDDIQTANNNHNREHYDNYGEKTSDTIVKNIWENGSLAERLGHDDHTEENFLLALLDFSGELARLGTVETARYGKPALAVAQKLLWHTCLIAGYANDAGVRGFFKKLDILRLSVGKLERLLTRACLVAEVGYWSAAGGTIDPDDDDTLSGESSAQPGSQPWKRRFSMVNAPSRFQDHSL